MKKQLKKWGAILGCLGLTLLVQGFLLSQAQHPKIKSLLEKPKPEVPRAQQLLEVDVSSPEQVGRVLSSQLPQGVAQQDTEKIAENLVKMVINPLKSNQEILDAVKAIGRYYTEGGSHDFGIKVDI